MAMVGASVPAVVVGATSWTLAALSDAIRDTSSVSGVAVVMDPRTGEVLAMSSLPSFNPNRFASFPEKDRTNRAVADAYEPGSIFKIITAASGLASATAMVIEPQIPTWGMAAACVGGGLVGAGLLFFIAWRGQISPIRLALAGVAMSAFFGAAIVALLSSSRTFLQTSLGFLAGGLYGADWRDFRATAVYIVPGILGAFLLAGRLNVLALGDDVASGLGILTDRTRVAILVVCGVLTAAAVAVAGLVSFVGLVCPHLARFAVGNDNRRLIPASALTGATLVAAADLAARVVIAPSEIPMGIITAGVGAPFLLYLVKFRG